MEHQQPATTERPWPLGTRLRAARKAARMSLREASSEAGISATTWMQLEYGVKTVAKGVQINANPRPAVVASAARVVGLDPAEALSLAGHDPSAYFDGSSSAPPTVSQRAALDLFARLEGPQRRAVYHLLETLLDTDAGAAVPVATTEDSPAQPDPDPHAGPAHDADRATTARRRMPQQRRRWPVVAGGRYP